MFGHLVKKNVWTFRLDISAVEPDFWVNLQCCAWKNARFLISIYTVLSPICLPTWSELLDISADLRKAFLILTHGRLTAIGLTARGVGPAELHHARLQRAIPGAALSGYMQETIENPGTKLTNRASVSSLATQIYPESRFKSPCGFGGVRKSAFYSKQGGAWPWRHASSSQLCMLSRHGTKPARHGTTGHSLTAGAGQRVVGIIPYPGTSGRQDSNRPGDQQLPRRCIFSREF